MTDVGSDIGGIITGGYAWITKLIHAHGYFAIFFLMVFESISVPLPSEVIIPLSGYLSATGALIPWLAYTVVLIGSIYGTIMAYSIGYYFSKELVYKHLERFRIKRQTLQDFEAWFIRNGKFAVFITRLIPEIRALASYPAGFVKMPMRDFLPYSIAGMIVWNTVLFAFGYYLISTTNVALTMGAVGIFAIVLYVIYITFLKHIRKKG